jgi:hypothetical protein
MSEPRLLRPRAVGSESAARPARVGTRILGEPSRAALGAGGRNGTDKVIHRRDEESHRARP